MTIEVNIFAAVGQVVGDDPESTVDISLGLGGSAIGAFLSTLLVGAILIALAPNYTRRMTSGLFREPVNSFLYGVFVLLVLILVGVLLLITIIGILFVIPLFVAAYLVWAVGSALAFFAIGRRLLDHNDWRYPLVLGAAINGGLVLTGIGGLISFAIGAIGFGAVVQDWRA